MRYTQYLVGLLSLYIGISTAAQRAEWERNWPNSNKDFGFEEREIYDEEGSADDRYPYDKGYDYDWERDYEGLDDYSGAESSHEDGSGSKEGFVLTDCQAHKMDVQESMRRSRPYDYMPQCLEDGEYNYTQCDTRKGQCWCVNFYGQEIPDTRKKSPTTAWCHAHDRSVVYDNGDKDISIDGDDFDKPIIKDTDPGLGTKQDNDNDDRDSNEQGDNDDLFVPATQPTHRATFLSQPLILADTTSISPKRTQSVTKRPPRVDQQRTTTYSVEVITVNFTQEAVRTRPPAGTSVFVEKSDRDNVKSSFIFGIPGILAGIIAFAVVCLLCAVLLVMFIVYRMRKKDEGSYALDEPKRSPAHPYQRAPTKEYFA